MSVDASSPLKIIGHMRSSSLLRAVRMKATSSSSVSTPVAFARSQRFFSSRSMAMATTGSYGHCC